MSQRNIKLTTTEFINRAIKIHGDKYDYSKVKYKGANYKIKIGCPFHGEFEQYPNNHLRTSGCPKCGTIKGSVKLTKSLSDIINKANKIHDNKYNYSNYNYIGIQNKSIIICPLHDEFEQSMDQHINQKQGCPKCGKLSSITNRTSTKYSFVNKANKIHDNKYDYSKVKYVNTITKVMIGCPFHGEFEQYPNNHLKGAGCPKCTNIISSYELEIQNFLNNNNIEFMASNRSIIKPYELDIIIPQYNLAIEFNGQYWHSEQMLKKNNKSNSYHKMKTDMCKHAGYQLLTIFESEWVNNKDIIKSIILNKCKQIKTKYHGRKCIVKLVNKNAAKMFFESNHIQGYSNGQNIGLYYNNILVSCITFSKYKNSYNLIRFVNKKYTIVHGAFGKLLKYFINTTSFDTIFTFADRRYFEGDVYSLNGFKFVHDVSPSYYYFKTGNELLHKRNYQHKRLSVKLNNYDNNLTEYQNMLNHNYNRIWDCGKIKYELKC